MNITIDIGNSRVKIGLFQEKNLVKLWQYEPADFQEKFLSELKKGKYLSDLKYLGWVNVGEKMLAPLLPFFTAQAPDCQWLPIHKDTVLPVENAYRTPETLGMDRIVAVCGAFSVGHDGPLLVIDAGTAITYDFLSRDNQYLGGGISPGLSTRFRALSTFTANLPLVELKEPIPLVGETTEESILSGVTNGFITEVEGTIQRYRDQFGSDTQVFLTGGDADFLGNHLKNVNFADSNLVLKGINSIIVHHQLHA